MAQKPLRKPLPVLVYGAEISEKPPKTGSGTVSGLECSLTPPLCRNPPKTALRGVVFVQHNKKKLKKPLTFFPTMVYCKYGNEKETKRPKSCDLPGHMYRYRRYLYRSHGGSRSSVSQVRKDSLAKACKPCQMRRQKLEFL